jgi:hypothetical protein
MYIYTVSDTRKVRGTDRWVNTERVEQCRVVAERSISLCFFHCAVSFDCIHRIVLIFPLLCSILSRNAASVDT